jgi:hypothetical protein
MENKIRIRLQSGIYGYTYTSNITGIVCNDDSRTNRKCDVTFKRNVPRSIRTGCSPQQIEEYDTLLNEIRNAETSYEHDCKNPYNFRCDSKLIKRLDNAKANFDNFAQNNQCSNDIITRQIKRDDLVFH